MSRFRKRTIDKDIEEKDTEGSHEIERSYFGNYEHTI
jgi:hypothetical protein